MKVQRLTVETNKNMGLIDQLNYNYEYKTPLTKELLLNFADDLDEYMAKEMPSSSHQGEARKIIEELLEYNTDTSTHSLSLYDKGMI